MLTSCTLPWTRSPTCDSESSLRDDSAFHEPEYASPAETRNSSLEGHSAHQDYANGVMIRRLSKIDLEESFVPPDYEEVDPVQVQQLRRALSVNKMRKNDKNNADNNTQRIMKSTIYCIHKESGCLWSGPLNGLQGHLNVCQKDALDCLNQCGAKIARTLMEDHMLYTCSKRLVTCPFCNKDFTGALYEDHLCGFEPVDCDLKCGAKIQRNRLKAHQINTCSKRLISCEFCTREFTADTLQSHHAKCPLFPLQCPKCYENVTREAMDFHVKNQCKASTKLQERLKCPYSDFGCTFVPPNAELLDAHLANSMQVHLDLMVNYSKKQQDLIEKLNCQLDKSETIKNGVLVWKIRDLKSRLEEAKNTEGLELVSAPFYTSQYGYRVQASLFLNGNGGGENSHMSVYIKLLPGEYDTILRWPFRHTVSFTLLDQSELRKDACNIVESFIPDPNWKNFQRPSREPDQLGFGFPKFVPHQMLQTRNYIRDDSIFIKIRVDPCRNVAV